MDTISVFIGKVKKMTKEEIDSYIFSMIEKIKSPGLEPPKFTKMLFQVLAEGFISEHDYIRYLDYFQSKHSDLIKKEFGYRMDNRTLGKFAVDVLANTIKESRIAKSWIPKYAERHFPGYKNYECSGVDGSGGLVFESFKHKKDIKCPDYILKPINQYIEVKYACCDYKATYKVADLEYYLKEKSYVLTMHYPDKREFLDCSGASFYTLLSPDDLNKILSACNVFKAREMGFKPCIQFHHCEDRWKSLVENGRISREAHKLSDFFNIFHL